MSYKKRGASPDAGIAQQRITALKQINPSFNLGNGLNIEAYMALLLKVTQGTETYNGLLMQADSVGSQLDIDERELSELNSRVLNAVGGIYGFDSIEYEKMGGVRSSDIKRTGRKSSSSTKE